MSEIFICYRRDDSPGHAGRLYSDLEEKFGESAVFFDRENIGPGERFPDSLRRNLESCKVVLVVIGRDWPPERLHRDGDYVCQEIAFGLQHRKVVIPVLVEGGVMPAAEELPSGLAQFVYCQYVELNDATWSVSVADLVARISRDQRIPLRKEPSPAMQWTPAAVTRLMREATIFLCMVVLALTFCAIAIRDDSAPVLLATKLLTAGGIFVMLARTVIGIRNIRSSHR